MNLSPASTSVAPVPVAQQTVVRDRRQMVQHAVDRGFRELAEDVPRDDVLRALCQGLAAALDVQLVMLVRHHEGGTLEMESTSRETLLWAEMMRLPERWDGTITGQGPASRALRENRALSIPVSDDGYFPWREAASRDGISTVSACPLDPVAPGWVLLLCAGSRVDPVHDDECRTAVIGCSSLIAASDRLAMRRVLASALDQAGNAAFAADIEGRIVWSNASFRRLTGHSAAEVIGRNPRFLSSGRHGVRYYRDLWDTIRAGDVWRGETVDRDRHGTSFTAIQTISPFGCDGRITHYLAIYEDVSKQRREDVRRELLSSHDPLTGLMHRAALEEVLAQRLAQECPLEIALVAATHLGPIEVLGEDAVTTYAVELQSRLCALAGAERAAKIGPGDYLVQLPEDPVAASQLVDTLQRELNEPYPLIGDVAGIGLRLGRASAPRDGKTVAALLRAADGALGGEPMRHARRRLERGDEAAPD